MHQSHQTKSPFGGVPAESIFRAMHEGVLILDRSCRAIAVNDSLARLFGFASAETMVPSLHDFLGTIEFLHPDGTVAAAKDWPTARVCRGEAFTELEVRARRSDTGQAWFFSVNGSPIFDSLGNQTQSLILLRDISARKQSERSWYEQKERLRAILNTATDAILTIDERGIVQSVNPAGERLFGYSASELIGKNVSILMPSPYREEHDFYISRFLRTKETKIIGTGREVLAQHKNGTLIPVDLAVSQVDHMKLFTGFIRDIRQRKELEREIVEIAALEQRRIGQNLHDECGQELTALGLLADSLVQSLEHHEPEKVRIAHMMEQGVRRVLRRIRNISRGLAQSEVTPETLADALVELTERLSETSGIRFSFKGEPKARTLGDVLTATHLFHIGREACTNALKHSQARNIEVRLQVVDGMTVLEVQDDGIGIANDAAEGLGRRIMRNRASVIGAELTVTQASPRGTLVRCQLRKESNDGQQAARKTKNESADRG